MLNQNFTKKSPTENLHINENILWEILYKKKAQ